MLRHCKVTVKLHTYNLIKRKIWDKAKDND